MLPSPLVLTCPGQINLINKFNEILIGGLFSLTRFKHRKLDFSLSLFGLKFSTCLRECSPITHFANTKGVMPFGSALVNCHYHRPFPRCSHGRWQYTT